MAENDIIKGMDDLLLQILEEVQKTREDVAICRAKLSWFKWQMGVIWTSLLALTTLIINIALKK
jgi:hypothetical protein